MSIPLRASAAVLAMVAVVSCRASSARTDVATASEQQTQNISVRGVVRVAGAEPLTTVLLDASNGTSETEVVGPLRSEIASIGGVEILARGVSAPARSPAASRGINVRSYDVIAVGDTPAHSGTLLERNGEYWLASSDTIQLAPPVSQAIAKLAGRRVYIAGRTTNGMLRVQAFGAIGSG